MTRSRRPAGRRRRRVALEWSTRAVSDLDHISDYIAADNPTAAERWVGKLLIAAKRAAEQPFAGRVVPELARADLRERLVGSYRLVYRLAPTRIVVLTVFEGHRRLPSELGGD